jgi:hypothetical protein
LVAGALSSVDRDDGEQAGAAGAAPITRPRTPWLKMR